jgi:putative phage-type endonuclease
MSLSKQLFTTTVYNKIVQHAKHYLSTLSLLVRTGNLSETSQLNVPQQPLTTIVENLQIFLSDDVEILNHVGSHSISKNNFHPDYLAMVLLHNFPEHIQNNGTYRFHTQSIADANLEINKRQLAHLKTIPTQKQGTQEWFDFRKTALTASNCYKVIYGSTRDKIHIILDKCSTETTHKRIYAPAMQHGTQHEDNGCNIFQKRSGKKVFEFGCMRHPLFNFLGASPDGIDEMGEMLEIKMPYSRIPHEIPKKDYYFQMQLQMEVCNLDVCNFLECVVKPYNSKEEYEKDMFENGKTKKDRVTHTSTGMEKGVMMEGISPSTNTFFYRYSSLGIMPNKIDAWLAKSEESIKKEATKKGFKDVKIRPVYWYAKKYSCIRVYKDSNWITNHIAEFHRFWRTIEYYRENGVEKLEKFMNTGKSNCLPKHPGIVNFPDMKVRKNTKPVNSFKNKCVIDVSDDDENYKTTRKVKTPSGKKTKKQKNTKGCMIMSDSSDDDLSIF